jgi:hypothetical protein
MQHPLPPYSIRTKGKQKKKQKQATHHVSNGSVLYGKFKQNHEKNDGTV